jgi:hypothetical protein
VITRYPQFHVISRLLMVMPCLLDGAAIWCCYLSACTLLRVPVRAEAFLAFALHRTNRTILKTPFPLFLC